jgi:hypothetical protein
MEKKYPPRTQVKRVDPSTRMLVAGTVMGIPFPVNVSASANNVSYTILFDNGSTASIPLSEMAAIIPSPPVCEAVDDRSSSLLPLFLQLNSKNHLQAQWTISQGFLWDM